MSFLYPQVCGLVYFSRPVAEKLLSFYSKPPLDACTYFGVDSGQPPIQVCLTSLCITSW